MNSKASVDCRETTNRLPNLLVSHKTLVALGTPQTHRNELQGAFTPTRTRGKTAVIRITMGNSHTQNTSEYFLS